MSLGFGQVQVTGKAPANASLPVTGKSPAPPEPPKVDSPRAGLSHSTVKRASAFVQLTVNTSVAAAQLPKLRREHSLLNLNANECGCGHDHGVVRSPGTAQYMSQKGHHRLGTGHGRGVDLEGRTSPLGQQRSPVEQLRQKLEAMELDG